VGFFISVFLGLNIYMCLVCSVSDSQPWQRI